MNLDLYFSLFPELVQLVQEGCAGQTRGVPAPGVGGLGLALDPQHSGGTHLHRHRSTVPLGSLPLWTVTEQVALLGTQPGREWQGTLVLSQQDAEALGPTTTEIQNLPTS